jgi:uncharacterized protein (DUF1697 family)
MASHIALLRAVNVGGRTVRMADLKALFEGLGLSSVRTLLQSGNVVFHARGGDAVDLEPRLEDAFRAKFGFHADILVRSSAEWSRAIEANPFAAEAASDPSHVLLMCLKAPPIAALEWPGPERTAVQGREAYLVYPDGIGRSKLTTAVIEKALGVRGSGRNWNTVLKLGSLVSDPG